jgi:hypothetical protein
MYLISAMLANPIASAATISRSLIPTARALL